MRCTEPPSSLELSGLFAFLAPPFSPVLLCSENYLKTRGKLASESVGKIAGELVGKNMLVKLVVN